MKNLTVKRIFTPLLLLLCVFCLIFGVQGIVSADETPNENVRIDAYTTQFGTGNVPLLEVRFNVDPLSAPYNGNYLWVARGEEGVYGYIQVNGETLSADAAGAVYDAHQYRNTLLIQVSYPEGTTITYQKGMGLVKGNGLGVADILTGDKLGYTYTFTLRNGLWELTFTDDPATQALRDDVHIEGYTTRKNDPRGPLLQMQFDIGNVPPYNTQYTWVARKEPGVYQYIKLNGEVLTLDEAGSKFDMFQNQNTLYIYTAYGEGTTLTFEKGMGLVNANGLGAAYSDVSGGILSGDKLGYSYTFMLTDGEWTLVSTDDNDALANEENVRINSYINIDNGAGQAYLQAQFDMDDTAYPYNGDYLWVARNEPGVYEYILLNGERLGEDLAAAHFDMHQMGNEFVTQKAYPEGTTITFCKGMNLVKANGAGTGSILSGDKLGYNYTFTLTGGVWVLTETDDVFFEKKGNHEKTDSSFVLTLHYQGALADGAVSADQLSSITLNDVAAQTATVSQGSVVMTFPTEAYKGGKDLLKLSSGLVLGGRTLDKEYSAYYLDYAHEFSISFTEDITKKEEVEFVGVREGTSITPSGTTHQQIILDFDMNDNTYRDFYNWGYKAGCFYNDIATQSYLSFATSIEIDGKPLKDCTNIIEGDGVYVHYRTNSVELYLKNDWFGTNMQGHTIVLKEGYLFPNGKYLGSDVTVRYDPSGSNVNEQISYEIGLSSIRLEDINVYVGKQAAISAVIKPSNATAEVTYSVENSSVAEVLENATIQGKAVGTTKLIAVSGNVRAECTVTVENAIAGIEKPADMVVGLNETPQLPQQVTAVMSDGTKIAGSATYDMSTFVNTRPGTYTIKGTFVPAGGQPFESGVSAEFEVRVSILDLSNLESAIEAGKEFVSSHNEDDYTTASWTTICGKLEEAESLFEKGQNEFVDMAEAERAGEELRAAIEGAVFTKVVTKEPIGNVNVLFGQNVEQILPEKVSVTYDNGTKAELNVTWVEIPKTDNIGTAKAKGIVKEKDGSDAGIAFTVTVLNYVTEIKNIPADKTVEFGSEHGLPQQVTLVLADGSEMPADVTYSGDYQKMTAGDYTLTGTIGTNLEFAEYLSDSFSVNVTVQEQKIAAPEDGGCSGGFTGSACSIAIGIVLSVALLIIKKRSEIH